MKLVKNTVLLYFLKKLTTPFIETDAYKLDLIDENGKILKKIKELRTQEEKNALTRLDVLIFNIKKIIQKFPFGKTRLASFAAALFLLKEHSGILESNLEESDTLLETYLEDYFERADYLLLKETAANIASSGNIAGLNGELKLKKQILTQKDYDEEIDAEVDSFFRRKPESIKIENKIVHLNKPFKKSNGQYFVYTITENNEIVKLNF